MWITLENIFYEPINIWYVWEWGIVIFKLQLLWSKRYNGEVEADDIW